MSVAQQVQYNLRKKFITVVSSQIQNYENQSSGTVIIEAQELPKSKGSNTDSLPFTSFRNGQSREVNRNEAKKEYYEIISENIGYDYLREDYPHNQNTIDEILGLMVDVVCMTKDTVRISGDDKTAEVVKSQFIKLDSEHIRFVLDAL